MGGQTKKTIGQWLLVTLLSVLDLEFIRPTLLRFYGEKWRWKKFDAVLMLKLDIYRVLTRHDFTSVIRHLQMNPDRARALGFVELPAHQTIWHWEKVRLGKTGLRALFEAMLCKANMLLAAAGIILGQHLGQDSTPVQSTREDQDAKFNPHYKLRMHKAHLLLDIFHGIPLNYSTTDGLAYDGHFLLPLVDGAEKLLQTHPLDCVGDGHYGSFENLAIMNMRGIPMIVKYNEEVPVHEEAEPAGLAEAYQKHREKPDWLPPQQTCFSGMLRRLFGYGEVELVGMHFRNRVLEAMASADYLDKYHHRSVNEGFHGVLKDHSAFARMRVSGSDNAEIHTAIHLIAFMAVSPLFKCQMGAPERFLSLSHMVV